MPPKKKKPPSAEDFPDRNSREESDALFEDVLEKKKSKPMTKKDKEKMKKMEKDMREKLIQLRKEADTMLAELKSMEEAAEKKNQTEMTEQAKRVEILSTTCSLFKTAKSRILHEDNKIREAEIWDRFIKTDKMPYPEQPANMHSHLYIWKQDKASEFMEFALAKCESYINTLSILNNLIEYPIYETVDTVKNWKETRQEWQKEFLYKIDKACFNMIKNLDANFDHEEQPYIMSFEDETEHLKIGMSAWLDRDNPVVTRLSPKIYFSSMNAEVVMPAAYRKKAFIFRLLHFEIDFFSNSSQTYNPPVSIIKLEPDMLAEAHRSYTARQEAKASVADREREKVKQAKHRVQEAQALASAAEKNLDTFHQKTRGETVTAIAPSDPIFEERLEPTLRKKKGIKDLRMDPSEQSLTSIRRPRGVFDDRDGASLVASLMRSEGTQRTVDAISMKSGMRSKDRMKKFTKGGDEELELRDAFDRRSMISKSRRQPKLSIRRASELRFEDPDEDSDSSESGEPESRESFDSLDFLFGDDEDEHKLQCKSIKTLVRHTTLQSREKARPVSKSVVSSDFSRRGRKRGKSIASIARKAGEDEEIPQTASEIFESKEDVRQENYMSSLLFMEIPKKRFHLNLRAYCTVGGTYTLDLIFHEFQPRPLRNGCSVQMFSGEMNIKRDNYEYNYVAPPPMQSTVENEEPPVDPGLQHLLFVRIPLPQNVVFTEPPVVGLWDHARSYWSTEHVHHLTADTEKNTASFYVGRVSPIAFFMKRHVLLPYLSWRMKPNFDNGGVSLYVNCVSVFLEMNIVQDEVCLSNAENAEGCDIDQVADFLGKYMHINKMIDLMKSRGLNVFPEEDSFLYAADNTAKDAVLEDHTNLSMAIFSNNLEFQSCNWNGELKRRRLAFHVRESLPHQLELRLRTVSASNLSAVLYRLSNEDNSFDETKLESFGFCPDVYTLLGKAFAHMGSAIEDPVQVLTAYRLLNRIKVLSYSGVTRKDTTSSSSDTSKKSVKKRPKKPQRRGKSNKAPGSRSSNVSTMFSTIGD